MPCGVLDLIASNKHVEDKPKNLIFEGDSSYYQKYIVPDDTNIKEQDDVLTIGERRLLDISGLNLFRPENRTYERIIIDNIDVGIIDTPEIYDYIEEYYQNVISFNKYRTNAPGEIEMVPPANINSGFVDDYDVYINPISNNLNINGYSIVDVFLGNVGFEDTSLGTIGRDRARLGLQKNFEANFLEETVGRLNTDIFSIIQGDPLIRKDFIITVPRTPIGRTLNYVQRLQGISFPFSYIPPEAFDLYNNTNSNASERNSILLNYTGKATRNLVRGQFVQSKHIYYPTLDTDDYYLPGNYYVAVEITDSTNTPEFNAKYLIFEDTLSAFGNPAGEEYFDGQYYPNVITKSDGRINPELIGDDNIINIRDVNQIEGDWSTISENLFSTKSLLYKTKEIVLNNSDLSFIDGFAKEYILKQGGENFKISRGSTITSKGKYTDDDGNVISANEFFRVFTKNKKYNRLSRSLRHRALDNGDTRSVLSENGIPFFAPTLRNRSGGQEIFRKYMFSISNAAWKGNAADLPECEKYVAPEGDVYRRMWFAPYDIKISEETSQNIEATSFFARPEPIYTANNAERTMTLSFALLIDHPSIINNGKGFKSHIWERYFKGDKSIENEINQLIKNRLTPAEQEQIKKIKQKFKPAKKIITDDVPSDTENEENKTAEAQIEVQASDISLFSIYFPNESVTLPPNLETGLIRLNAGYEDALGTTLGYTYLNGVQKTNIQYRDKYNYGLNAEYYNNSSIIEPIFIDEFNNYPQKIEIIFIGSASAATTNRISNLELSKQRAENAKNWFVEQYNTLGLSNLKPTGTTIEYKIEALSDNLDTVTVDNSAGDLKTAKENRRVQILLKIYPQNEEIPEEEITPQSLAESLASDNLNDQENTDNSISEVIKQLDNSIIEKLFQEPCDTFKFLENNDPAFYNTISEQIDFFHPSFHSYTPQNFNERLTFLQQCCRNSNNIGLGDGNPTNLFYGYQPVVYISIGDFFKTKAMIRSLSIDYNQYSLQWDTNPESRAGVQPMFASITLSLYIMGGQSMSGALSRLQNALSFNYYANTEMYDVRADSIIINQDGEAEIIDGIKLSELASQDEISEAEGLVNLRQAQGEILESTQKFQNAPTEVSPSEINDVNDLILLKQMLNL